MVRRGFRPASVAVVGALLMAACSSSDSLTSSTPTLDTPPSSTVAPPTTATPATIATTIATTTTSTTSTASTASPDTIVPATTGVPATTAAPATTPPTAPSTDPTSPRPPQPATAFVNGDSDLLEIDVATGAVLRTVAAAFSGEGVFRGGLRLSPDRATIWFGEGYEDGWFSCDSSVGEVGRVRLDDGAVELVDSGWNPDPSPDGTSVAYISSRQCLPDPENPEFWVLTPGDRVIVRDLATGDTREFVTSSPPEGYGAATAVEWVGFAPDGALLVLVGDGRLFAVDLDGPGVIQDHPVELPAVLGFPVGVTAGDVLSIDVGDEGSSDLYAVDRGGAGERFLASAEAFLLIGVSAGGHVLASSSTPVDIGAGVELSLLDPGDAFLVDIDW